MSNWITAYEVIKYSPAGRDYPTEHVCTHIPIIEEKLRRECLGDTLSEYLDTHLQAIPAGVSEWLSTTNYPINAVVIRNGCLYQSAIANNMNDDPLDSSGDWDFFDRFDDTGCEMLWTRYLRQIIAFKVYAETLILTTFKSDAGGIQITDNAGAGFNSSHRSAKKDELYYYKGQVLEQVGALIDNMKEWMDDNAGTYDLPSIGCNTGCEPASRRSRRFFFAR